MYKIFIRPFLFLFDPEAVHYFSFSVIKYLSKLGFGSITRRIYTLEDPALEREVFGLKFKKFHLLPPVVPFEFNFCGLGVFLLVLYLLI